MQGGCLAFVTAVSRETPHGFETEILPLADRPATVTREGEPAIMS